jgi:isoaspartyl peptidase/L-asparaginase-like protein (Ntn-hydrolase superfamily)
MAGLFKHLFSLLVSGYGSSLTIDGRREMDAIIMNGKDFSTAPVQWPL